VGRGFFVDESSEAINARNSAVIQIRLALLELILMVSQIRLSIYELNGKCNSVEGE